MGRKRDTKYDTAYELYLTGLSLEQVAIQMGITRQSVYKAFKKRGFVLRGPNFQPEQFYDGKKFTLRAHGYYELTTGKRTLMHRYIWEKEVGPIPDGFDIHHLDEIKSNNYLSNFECLDKAEHTRKYSPHNNQYTKGRKKNEINKEGICK